MFGRIDSDVGKVGVRGGGLMRQVKKQRESGSCHIGNITNDKQVWGRRVYISYG